MAKLTKKMSITSRSLRPQLAAAFCLMSVIPILVLLNFIFPSIFPKNQVFIIVGIVVVMSLLGFLLVKKIVDSIIVLCSEAKVIINGELSHKIDITTDDEIGDLSSALNQLTQHIKSNMDELKIYGERTKDINVQINKQMLALNGLLQISNLITNNAELFSIFEIIISKLSQVASSSVVFIIFKKEANFEALAHYGLKEDALDAITASANAYLFNNLFGFKPCAKSDSKAPEGVQAEILKLLGTKNLLCYPIVAQNRPIALLGIGNQLERFYYSDDDVEMMNIFAKQVAIAIENDFLTRKVKDLETQDTLTGLYNKRYIMTRLNEEILRAIRYQRPCAFLVVKIKNIEDIQSQCGRLVAEDVLKKIGSLLKTFATEIDKIGRLNDNEFGIVLPEKNKRRAQELAWQVKDNIDQSFRTEEAFKKPITLIAVVENPIDGADSVSLFAKAESLLKGKNEGF